MNGLNETQTQASCDVPDHFHALETECGGCMGLGRWRRTWGDVDTVVCPDCHGKKILPTEFGEQVLELIRRNSDRLAARTA